MVSAHTSPALSCTSHAPTAWSLALVEYTTSPAVESANDRQFTNVPGPWDGHGVIPRSRREESTSSHSYAARPVSNMPATMTSSPPPSATGRRVTTTAEAPASPSSTVRFAPSTWVPKYTPEDAAPLDPTSTIPAPASNVGAISALEPFPTGKTPAARTGPPRLWPPAQSDTREEEVGGPRSSEPFHRSRSAPFSSWATTAKCAATPTSQYERTFLASRVEIGRISRNGVPPVKWRGAEKTRVGADGSSAGKMRTSESPTSIASTPCAALVGRSCTSVAETEEPVSESLSSFEGASGTEAFALRNMERTTYVPPPALKHAAPDAKRSARSTRPPTFNGRLAPPKG
mmetsp:Transcript_20722/g.49231  ORF Transcript_20722/g.49231 Transcript_20722/m.49231 type:complete len:345 (-) Transcript_20722:934-1968(-)